MKPLFLRSQKLALFKNGHAHILKYTVCWLEYRVGCVTNFACLLFIMFVDTLNKLVVQLNLLLIG